MRDIRWTSREKKIARSAFNLALNQEMQTVRRKVEAMLQASSDPSEIWNIHDYLSKRRKAIDKKYDYRYSVLLIVFGRLIHEGWLTEADLSGLAPEKLEVIRKVASLGG